MTGTDRYSLTGADLRVARRAIAVALVMSVSSDEVHAVRAHLPSHTDMLRVLDVLGWAGPPAGTVAIASHDRRVLLDAVYAMLILACEETAHSADDALRDRPPTIEADASVLLVAESLAGLARRLQGPGPDGQDTAAAAGHEATESQVSPALRTLADSIGLPVWMASTEFVLEWINPALAALLDADLDQIRGTSWRHWSDPNDVPRVAQVLDAARLEHRNWSVEVGAGPPGGPYTRLLMIAAPRWSPEGALGGWTGICFDVTRNPTLATRLEATTQSLTVDTAKTSLFLRQLPAMIWTTDLELRCTFSHGAGFESIGAEPNQLVGRSVGEIVGTTDIAHPALVAHRAALSGETARYRDAFAQRVFDVIVEPLRNQAGAIFGCVGLGIEVTESVARELRVQQLLRQLEFGQRIGRIGTWEFDVCAGTWVWSDEAFRLLGAEPGSLEPNFATFLSRVHRDDRDRLRDLYAEGLRTGATYEVDYRIERPDGEVRHMRGVVAYEHDPEGTLIRVAGILQDVTPAVASARDIDLGRRAVPGRQSEH
jgi:PAS domain-containing protein